MGILVGNMTFLPVFDGKSVSFVFSDFREVFLEVRKRRITIWRHIDYREDDLIGLPETKKLFIYLRSSADEGSFDTFTLKISIKLFY